MCRLLKTGIAAMLLLGSGCAASNSDAPPPAGASGGRSAGAGGASSTSSGGSRGNDVGSGGAAASSGTGATGGGPAPTASGGGSPAVATGGSGGGRTVGVGGAGTSNGGAPGAGGGAGRGSRGGAGVAGSGVAGAGAGGVEAVGSGCGTRPYKLCEDFESADVGGLPPGWMQFELYRNGKPGTVNVQSDQFHGGSKALKSSSDAIDEPRVRRSLAGLGALANNHWGRIFYKVQIPAPRPNTYFHVTFAALTKDPAAPESRIVDTVQDPTGRLQYLYNLPDDTCCTMTGFSGAFDASWHCAEWYISQTTNSYRFFQDGREIPISFTGNTRARIANISYIALGTSFYQVPPGPFVAWIDDLIINDTQIGCGP